MANTYTSLHYHVVFSTKHREPLINREIEVRVWAYLAGIARQNKLHPLLIGGMDDHVHLLLGIPPTVAISDAIKRLKNGSSVWMKESFSHCPIFGWQDGYGAFTVSKSLIPDIENYIRNQREHHRIKTFEEEYRTFLNKHEISFEEQYLLD